MQTRIVCRVDKPHTKTSVIVKYQLIVCLIVCLLIFIVFWTGYASRQNPYLKNKSTLGLIGGAAGGAILCKNCKGVSKVASISGGALLGIFLGISAGEYCDVLLDL